MFNDESRVALDGPDGLRRGWVLHENFSPTRLGRQQCGVGVLF